MTALLSRKIGNFNNIIVRTQYLAELFTAVKAGFIFVTVTVLRETVLCFFSEYPICNTAYFIFDITFSSFFQPTFVCYQNRLPQS
jgi:hypothetical protein